MDIALSPAGLWIPKRPAIVRASSLKDALKDFVHAFGGAAAAQLASKSGGATTYRYLRVNVTKIIYASGPQSLPTYSLRFSDDLGSTFFPASAMTTNTAPSPLVASNVSSQTTVWNLFDQNNTTLFNPATPAFTSQVPASPWWVQLDLGAGNERNPNALQIAMYNTGGVDCSWVDFTLNGSNDAFASQNDLLKSWTGQTSKTHQALNTFT